jgi:hypothetical protein
MTHLLQILKDHIHSTPTTPFTTDWSALIALAKKHEVAGILFFQCKDFIPEPYLTELNTLYSSVMFFYANRQSLIQKIESSLSDIQHFTIKGSSVAAYYPFPAFRTMGDTDIVVHTEDRVEADKRLRSLGLNCIATPENHDWQYFYNDMEFEIHDHLVYPQTINVDKQVEYFNDFWKHVKGNKLDWNFHFMFLILHLRKHFMNSGVGFRQFLDIAVLCDRGPAFDWRWIKTELEKLDLWVFTERVFALNKYWFDVKPPVTICAFDASFFTSATELIGRNGIFGFDNEENRGNTAVNAIRGEGYSKSSMLKRAVKGLFPPYKTLITVPTYAYLKNRPWLLPFVWIHRAFRSIKEGRVRRNMRAVATSSFADKETIEKREAVYQEWGL